MTPQEFCHFLVDIAIVKKPPRLRDFSESMYVFLSNLAIVENWLGMLE